MFIFPSPCDVLFIPISMDVMEQFLGNQQPQGGRLLHIHSFFENTLELSDKKPNKNLGHIQLRKFIRTILNGQNEYFTVKFKYLRLYPHVAKLP